MSSAAITAIAAGVLFVLIIGGACVAQYRAFGYGDFDLADHVQSVWMLLHGSLDCTLLGLPWPGNHANWILLLVAPIFAVVPSPLTLLALQTLAVALATWPIYLLAKKEFNSEWCGSFFVFAYCLYAPVGHAALYEFHPVVFATPMLLAAFYCARIGNDRWFIVWNLLAATCQEDIPLMIIALCVHRLLAYRNALTVRSRIASFSLIGVMMVWFLLCVAVIGPHFNKGGVGWLSLYGQFGKSGGEILRNMILRPDIVLRTLSQPDRIDFLLRVLGPLLFLSLLAPEVLLIAAPSFAQHMLSLRTTEISVIYHYTAAITPFVMAASVIGTARLFHLLERIPSPKVARWISISILLIMAVVLTVTQYNYGIYRKIVDLPEQFHRTPLAVEKDRLLSLIPRDASVICTFDSMARLAMRRHCYSMHAVVSGHKILSDERSAPPQVEYAAVDFADELTFQVFYHATKPLPDGSTIPSSAELMREFFEGKDWTCLGWVNSFAVFRRVASGQATGGMAPIEMKIQGVAALADGSNLVVFRERSPASNDAATLEFRWSAAEKPISPTPSYWLWVHLTPPKSAQPISFLHGPCQLFPKADSQWKILLKDVPGGEYDMSVVVYDRRAMAEAMAKDKNALASFKPAATVSGGKIEIAHDAQRE